MSKRAAYNSDADEQPPHKKPSAAATHDGDDNDSDTIVVCEISKNRRVSVRNWNGKIFVDIREFYVKDGKTLPGKKGIRHFSSLYLILFRRLYHSIIKLVWYVSLAVNLIEISASSRLIDVDLRRRVIIYEYIIGFK
ncbi:hypothetical protein Leryth_006481 [Lithospermum erythrorhizon]|nr:hypothetical protein Leryth_006481 [Lithospermum erythrorhizon]